MSDGPLTTPANGVNNGSTVMKGLLNTYEGTWLYVYVPGYAPASGV